MEFLIEFVARRQQKIRGKISLVDPQETRGKKNKSELSLTHDFPLVLDVLVPLHTHSGNEDGDETELHGPRLCEELQDLEEEGKQENF